MRGDMFAIGVAEAMAGAVKDKEARKASHASVVWPITFETADHTIVVYSDGSWMISEKMVMDDE